MSTSKESVESQGTRTMVPLWTLVMALGLCGLGWMAATFAIGSITSSASVKVGTDFVYVVAKALFVGSTAGIFFRYMIRRDPEEKSKDLEVEVENVISALHQTHTGPFVTKEKLPPIRSLIECADEFFYVGGNCRALLQGYPHDLQRWVDSGKKLVFLIQDPENEGLRYCEMPCVKYDYKKYVADSHQSISILEDLAGSKDNVELYLTKMTPTQSLAFADPERPEARVSMFLHLPDGESNTAPCISFFRAENPFWFDLFYTRYKQLRGENRSRKVLPKQKKSPP